jgi:hypothetical protein
MRNHLIIHGIIYLILSRVMIKRLIYYTYFLPLSGIILLYLYILSAMVELQTFDIYDTDPKDMLISISYNFVRYYIFICLVSVIGNILLLALRNILLPINKAVIFYFIGVLLFFLLFYFDPFSLFNWFFD